MARIDLPDGGWAEIRDSADDMPNRLKRTVDRQRTLLFLREDFRQVAALGTVAEEEREKAARDLERDLGPERFAEINDLLADLANAQAAAMVTGWSYDAPVTVETVDDLPTRVHAALVAAVDRAVAAAPDDDKAALLDPTPVADASSG